MDYKKKYIFWIEDEYFDEETTNELKELEGNEVEIEDRFYKDLEFGTGGMRGKIGAGTNRINKYTVARATQGLAHYIIENEELRIKNGKTENENQQTNELSVVIAYDSRYKSDRFCECAARVLAANNIKTYIFDSLRPTPELSFAVRYLKADGGIVITASHNPSDYNGYKVYGSDGGQMVPRVANKVIENISKIENFSEIKMLSKKEALDKGLIVMLDNEVDNAYIERVKSLSIRKEINKDIKIVYTPLHGTGNIPVRRTLKELGFENVYVVEEQELPDNKFSTVDYPNPEDPKAFKLAMKVADKVDADILLGTDPDCDRVGVVVKNNDGEFVVLNGNQTGALLLDYILEGNKDNLPQNGVLVKTIVTSELGRVIARKYGLDTVDTLTGFKFIGEKIKEFEENNNKEFMFGYEESFGYLTGTFVRDKDGVIASMLICEMAAYYKGKGLSLYEALNELYKKYGYYIEELESIKLEGIEGKKKIEKVMDSFREDYPLNVLGSDLVRFDDYKVGKSYTDVKERKDYTQIDLPKSNVLKFFLSDESWYALRPSGTEPKLKIYFSVNGKSEEEAKDKLKSIKEKILDKVNSIIDNA